MCVRVSLSLLCSGFSVLPAVAVFHPSLPAAPGTSATGICRAGGEELASLAEQVENGAGAPSDGGSGSVTNLVQVF